MESSIFWLACLASEILTLWPEKPRVGSSILPLGTNTRANLERI